jgi:vancomycin permeability regulator SanA
MRKFFIVTFVALALYVCAAAAIAWVGLHDQPGTADMIIVPGNTVYADGSVSRRLAARLDAAIDLLEQGKAPIIFVSGGTDSAGQDEAAAMASYLLKRGIAATAIVQDPLGRDTNATAKNAAQYLQMHKLSSALVATQYFHVARTTLALQRHGVQVTGSRHARYTESRDIYSLAREVLGYARYLFINPI